MSQLDMELHIEKKKVDMKSLNEHTTKQWFINKISNIVRIKDGIL